MPIGEQVDSWITCKRMAHGRDLALPGTTFQVGFIGEEKRSFPSSQMDMYISCCVI